VCALPPPRNTLSLGCTQGRTARNVVSFSVGLGTQSDGGFTVVRRPKGKRGDRQGGNFVKKDGKGNGNSGKKGEGKRGKAGGGGGGGGGKASNAGVSKGGKGFTNSAADKYDGVEST
jgi:hypothetical protein